MDVALARLIVDAANGFRDDRGASNHFEEEHFTSYDLTFSIAGMKMCTVLVNDDASYGGPTAGCTAYRGTDRAAADQQFAALESRLNVLAASAGGDVQKTATGKWIRALYRAPGGASVRVLETVAGGGGTPISVLLRVEAPSPP